MTTPAPAPTRTFVPIAQRELLRARELMALFGWKRSKLREMVDRREIPQPIELGGVQFWRRRELCDWLDCSCPFVGNGDWIWQPTIRVSAHQAHALAAKQLIEAQAQLRLVNQQIENGERMIELRRTV